MTSLGKRYQIIVLQVMRNEEKAIMPLMQLKTYFEKRGEKYKVVSFEYGRLTKALAKTLNNLINLNLFSNPKETLYRINKTWIDNKLVSSIQLENFAYKSDFEKIFNWIKGDKK